MNKAEKMTHLVGRLFHQPIDEIFVAGRLPVEFVVQPGCGDDSIPCAGAGEAEKVFVTGPAEIIGDNEKDEILLSGTFLVKVQ